MTAPRLQHVNASALFLSPVEGFASGHTYHVRIAQLIAGKEVVLAESELTLE